MLVPEFFSPNAHIYGRRSIDVPEKKFPRERLSGKGGANDCVPYTEQTGAVNRPLKWMKVQYAILCGLIKVRSSEMRAFGLKNPWKSQREKLWKVE